MKTCHELFLDFGGLLVSHCSLHLHSLHHGIHWAAQVREVLRQTGSLVIWSNMRCLWRSSGMSSVLLASSHAPSPSPSFSSSSTTAQIQVKEASRMFKKNTYRSANDDSWFLDPDVRPASEAVGWSDFSLKLKTLVSRICIVQVFLLQVHIRECAHLSFRSIFCRIWRPRSLSAPSWIWRTEVCSGQYASARRNKVHYWIRLEYQCYVFKTHQMRCQSPTSVVLNQNKSQK